MKTTIILTAAALIFSACGGTTSNQNEKGSSAPPAKAAPPANAAPEYPTVPKDGVYAGRGKITKINAKGGSLEIDHQDIPGLMRAMKMELSVKDKAMLNDLKTGDNIKFEIEYKHPTETITTIKKLTE